MRTVIVTIAAALFSLSVAADNDPVKDPDNYCVKNKNGKMILVHNGNEVAKTIKLSDGTRVKPNGTIVFTDGKRIKLRQGECVDENNLCHFSERMSRMEEKKEARKQKREYSDTEYK